MTVVQAVSQPPRGSGGKVDEWVNKYVDLFVLHPCKCFWPCCVAQFLIAVISIAAGTLVPEQKEGAWLVFDNANTQFYKAWDNVEEKVGVRRLKEVELDLEAPAWPTTPPSRKRGRRRLQGPDDDDDKERRMQFFYKTNVDETGTIFTPRNIATMCRLEKIALMSSIGTVEWLQSPAAVLYGDNYMLWGDCPEKSQGEVDTWVNLALASVRQLGTQSPFAAYVHPNFNQTGESAYTKSIVAKWIEDDDDLKDWAEEIYTPLGLGYGFLQSAYQGDEDRFVEYEGMRVRLMQSHLDEINMISVDFSLAVLAFVFVYVVMYIYLKSFWLASWGMYMIVFSLPIGSFFYNMLFQIKYFEFLHILIVYLVLGIGADDIFVLIDTFRHLSGENPPWGDGTYDEEEMHKIMKMTFTRAASAILNTSFTTTVAFLSSSVSKVMPMRTCGYFAAICIITVYVLTITFYPAVLAIHHYYFQGKRCCCPTCERRAPGLKPSSSKERVEPKLGPMERVMDHVYVPIMSYRVGPIKPFALLGVLIMLGVATQGIVNTAQLTPPRKEEVWVPDNHMQLELNKFMSANYLSPDYEDFALITVYWGIKELDTSDMDAYNPQDFKDGIVFDDTFDPSTSEAQAFIKTVCQQLRTVACTLEGCKSHPYGTLMMQLSQKSHSCFLEDFEQWWQNQGRSLPIPTGQQFKTELMRFRSEAPSTFESQVIESDYQRRIGVIDGELKYVAVAIRSTMPGDEPFKTGIDVRDLVDGYVNQWEGQAPSTMKNMKYIAEGAFASYDLGDELIKGLFSGCAISLPIAFLVLLFSTRNVVVASYAVVCVAFIVTSVLGFCKSAMDWDLGIGEAIAGVIVIGYSVDYVVHLAHIYCEGKHHGCNTRDERCQFAIESLGTTVFAGAVTTAGSGAIMFICYFYFFFKMAILITITIMYSFLYALILFMGLLWLIGPEHNFGDLCCRLPCDSNNKVHDESPYADAKPSDNPTEPAKEATEPAKEEIA